MKPIWVVILVTVLVGMSFIAGRMSAPKPVPSVRDSIRVVHDTLAPSPSVVQWKTKLILDTARVNALIRDVQNKDSLIAVLGAYKRTEGTWQQEYETAIDDSIYKIPVTGQFTFGSDPFEPGAEVFISVDTLMLPRITHYQTSTVVIEKGMDVFTIGAIVGGGILLGYAIHDIVGP